MINRIISLVPSRSGAPADPGRSSRARTPQVPVPAVICRADRRHRSTVGDVPFRHAHISTLSAALLSSAEAARHNRTRDVTSAVAMSASANRMAGSSIASAERLALAHIRQRLIEAACAPPSEQAAMFSRPPLSPFIAILKPSPPAAEPVPPAPGLVEDYRAVGWAFQPILPRGAETQPGRTAFDEKAEMPLRAILAGTGHHDIEVGLLPAPEMNCFSV